MEPIISVVVIVLVGVIFFVVGCRFFSRRLNEIKKVMDRNSKDIADLNEDHQEHEGLIRSLDGFIGEVGRSVEDMLSELRIIKEHPVLQPKPARQKPVKPKSAPKPKAPKQPVFVEQQTEYEDEDEDGVIQEQARGYDLPQAPQPKTSTRRGNPTGRVM